MNGIEIWTRFDARLIATELARGKRYFSGMNAVRIWLAWDAFRLDNAEFARNFEEFLKLIDANGWTAMPILFNRWQGSPEFDAISASQSRRLSRAASVGCRIFCITRWWRTHTAPRSSISPACTWHSLRPMARCGQGTKYSTSIERIL
jgi:hypothetical protein